MKELSIEEKAKAYDEAIGRTKKLHETCDSTAVVGWCEYIFPELKESEDEKIRKTLIDYFNTCSGNYYGELKCKDILAWLEKQSEPTDINPSEFDLRLNKLLKQFETLPKEELASSLSFYLNVVQNNRTYKQGEQKSVDKVEPKFKVGKWYIDNEDGTIFQIVKVLNNTYTYKTNEGKEYSCSHYSLENDAHLWTIQDAKPGVVLTNGKMIVIFKHFEEPSYRQHIVAYIGLDNNGDIQITDDTWTLGIDKAKPATKEQRDTLFKKMKEAGYTFDFEKKELKKIEQNNTMVEALHTEYEKGRADAIAQMKEEWSEEDEEIINSITSYLCTHDSCELDGFNKWYDFLKSLKERYIWKPSEEQMEALFVLLPTVSYGRNPAFSLYNDLKKLKGE